MQTYAQVLNQAFTYDFNKMGGAVGVYKTGIAIPFNAPIVYMQVFTFQTVTTAGAPGIRVQLNNPAFFQSLAIGQLVAGLWVDNIDPPGVNNNIPHQIDSSTDVFLSIDTDPLTGGKFTCFMQYYLL